MAGLIEDYALIGDMQTAALVCRDGSADWLCLPRFDSPAVFAGLLGSEHHGFWRIGPAHAEGTRPPAANRRHYRGESLILESEWDVPGHGTVRVIDFMPTADGRAPQLVRIVKGVTGRVRMRSTLHATAHYGQHTAAQRVIDGRTAFSVGTGALWLDTSADVTVGAGGDFTIGEGDSVTFTLTWRPRTWHPDPAPAPLPADARDALLRTEAYWQRWAAQSAYRGPYTQAVTRSALTLKALIFAQSGAPVAAPTTSLPEDIGGIRNWDYRCTWLRDAALTMIALLSLGYLDEARAWRAWLVRVIARDLENLQIMYGIAGERTLSETELDWLPGYENSAPVRIGNGAATQLQLDVYGEVIDALYQAHLAGLEPDPDATRLMEGLVIQLEECWRTPDEGIWEVRGPRRHFVHSKVMAWVAFDRIVKLIEAEAAAGPLQRWRELRDTIWREVCEKGYDPVRNTFTQSYGSKELDASLLLIPQVGFLPPDDKRVIGTIEAIQRELSTPDGFILRYPTEGDNAGVDGLPGDEGAFLLCTFWMADDLAMIGRVDEARQLFENLLSLCSDLGLLAEEWDPKLKRQVGNYPQAFSHIGLILVAVRRFSTPEPLSLPMQRSTEPARPVTPAHQ
ncbi:glycoside hydrolase family 15 protein [Streptomyces sp. Go40/10]|uniref:glycoside hydrolase family 15 protein n=1 Tax=Streptomyces sp. Go40/10 TaxID=2825844 RepID=UPI001E31B30C|nr:glycoside hydrolase family 15 protein [Streptomyces sp. Go40/10]UFQ99789.1 glycoside hydrolase family 15 protein [Streptomyces sp. Go40/10]